MGSGGKGIPLGARLDAGVRCTDSGRAVGELQKKEQHRAQHRAGHFRALLVCALREGRGPGRGGTGERQTDRISKNPLKICISKLMSRQHCGTRTVPATRPGTRYPSKCREICSPASRQVVNLPVIVTLLYVALYSCIGSFPFLEGPEAG